MTLISPASAAPKNRAEHSDPSFATTLAHGLDVLATAYPLLSAIKVRQTARPLMRDFAAYAGGTVSIAMPFGLDFIYVETLRTTDAVPHVPDVGFTGTLAPTAVGRALLSLFTKEELDAYVAGVRAER